eukprot:325353-Pelagomonas_calceolata.AAC.1
MSQHVCGSKAVLRGSSAAGSECNEPHEKTSSKRRRLHGMDGQCCRIALMRTSCSNIAFLFLRIAVMMVSQLQQHRPPVLGTAITAGPATRSPLSCMSTLHATSRACRHTFSGDSSDRRPRHSATTVRHSSSPSALPSSSESTCAWSSAQAENRVPFVQMGACTSGSRRWGVQPLWEAYLCTEQTTSCTYYNPVQKLRRRACVCKHTAGRSMHSTHTHTHLGRGAGWFARSMWRALCRAADLADQAGHEPAV